MEENNELNNTKNVENSTNVEQNNNQTPKSPKAKKVIVGVTCVVVVAGVITGIALNKDKIFTSSSNENTTVAQNSIQSEGAKKIDESKPWVYDAEYLKENKKIYQDSAKTEEYAVNSDKDLIVPYININSEYAQAVNESIKALYNDYYSRYGTEYNNPYNNEYKEYNHYTLKYDNYLNDNILSIVITLSEGVAVVDGGTGGGTFTKYTYNFNLDTLNEATLNEMALKCGFSSEYAVTSKIKEWEDKQSSILIKADQLDIFRGVQNGKYFMDENGKLNFLFRISTSATGDSPEIIEPDKEIELFYTEEQANEQIKINNEQRQNQTITADTDLSQFNNLFYKNSGIKTNIENAYDFYELYFDKDGKPTIKIGSKSTEQTEAYFITQSINNLKTDVAAGTSYTSFDFTAWSPGGDITGSATIRFSNVADNSQLGLKASANINGTARDFSDNGDYVVLTRQNVTGITYKDEFTDNAKEITLYGRYFSTFPGTSARNRIYYINENNELCKTYSINGGYATDILAKNVKRIEANLSEVKLHIYPMASNFYIDDIYLEDECTYFENIYFDPDAFYSANNKGDIIKITNQHSHGCTIKFNHAYSPMQGYNRKFEGTATITEAGTYCYVDYSLGKEYKLNIKFINDKEIEMSEYYDGNLTATEHLYK